MSSNYTEVTEPYAELRLHSSGEWVKYAQDLLTTHGFGPGATDGLYSPETEARVREFQGAFGLTVDGVIGAATWTALAASPQPPMLEFAFGPSLSGIGMEWTVRNTGGSTVPKFTELGDYEVWDRTDITKTVVRRQTFTTLHDIPPSGTEPFFIDLESISPTDGQYKAVVQMGTAIKELDYDIRAMKVQAP